MKNFIIDVTKYTVLSAASTLGFLIGLGVWGAGLGEIVEEKTSKIFHKKQKGNDSV